jgi:hypothetical protein
MGNDVYVVYPMYMQKYKLWDVNAKAGAMRGDLARMAMDEMNRFQRRTESQSARGPAAVRRHL